MKIRKIIICAGIILFVYILSTMDLWVISTIFTSIGLLYIILCSFASLPIVLLSNYQWQILLKHHRIRCDYKTSLKNILIGYFYGFITPGGIGGYTRVVYLHDATGVPLNKCMSNIVLFNTIDYLSLLLIGLMGGFTLAIRFPQLYAFELIIIILIGIVLALVYLFLIRKGTLHYVFNVLLRSSFLHPYKEKFNGSIQQFYEDMPQLRHIFIPFILSLAGWMLRFVEFYLIAQLFSVSIPIFFFIAIVAIGDIVASLPISIYGLGTREVTLIGLFSLFNIPSENVLSLSLFWFAISWVVPSLYGMLITIIEVRSRPSASI
jgi:uncharacterized protein (TIRG00374 family)